MKLFLMFFPIVCYGAEGWLSPIVDVEVSHLKKPLEFEWKADPFLREPGRAFIVDEKAAAFVLETIIFDKTRPLALINKIAVEKGDRIGNRRVKEIGRNYVVLEGEQSLLELVLAPVADTVETKNEK